MKDFKTTRRFLLQTATSGFKVYPSSQWMKCLKSGLMFHLIDRVLIYCFDLVLNEQKTLNGDHILKKLMKL